MNVLEIRDAIIAGEFDGEDLEELRTVIRMRQNLLKDQQSAVLRFSLKRGDFVRIREDAGLRPKYLNGMSATVVKVNQKTATIDFDSQLAGRYRNGCRCPLPALEQIDASERDVTEQALIEEDNDLLNDLMFNRGEI